MEEALQDSAIEKTEKTNEGYSFWLKGIPVEISVMLSINPLRGGFNFKLSHYIKTPSQIGPYRPSRPWGDSKDYALNLAISAITQYYKEAIKEGYVPSNEWLHPSQPSPDPPQFEPSLNSQQKALYQKLHEKKTFLAEIYIGGLHVLQQKDNPDQLPLAAHNFRELMEKLPLYVDIKIKPSASLGEKVRHLYGIWKKIGPLTEIETESIGNFNKRHKKVFEQINSFFQWYGDNPTTRKEQIKTTLRAFEQSGRFMPNELEKINIESWNKLRDFFVSVAHHNKEIDTKEFMGYLDWLEKFILERLVPRTFEDFEKIDKIIGA